MKIKILTAEEFTPLIKKHRPEIFGEDLSYSYLDLFSKEEINQLNNLRLNMGSPFKLHLVAYSDSGELMGWCWGFQENSSDFYMCNSAVFPEFRRQGIYSQMLIKCLDILKREGFQMVYSKHRINNNAVIIPKLKKGFVISKMEMDDRYGTMIHLHYYFNSTRYKIIDFRSGERKPNQEIKDLFNI